MKHCIPPSFYSDVEVFNKEQDILFQNIWHFAGFTTDVENHNDYICTQIGGKSVIVQNFHGELRAFHNVCSHRFSRIHIDSQGNSPLKCPYHGWVYNSDGIPVGIPNRAQFDELNNCVLESLKLEKWSVEIYQSLIFVNKDLNSSKLNNFLEDNCKGINKVTNAIGRKIDNYELIIKANWKVCVENTLEGYHVGSVHSKTFERLGMSSIQEYTFEGLGSSVFALLDNKTNAKWEKIKSAFATRPLKIDGYLHQLIFPNLTMATTYGASISIQYFQPLAPDKTKFTSQVFLSKLENLSAAQQLIVNSMSYQIVQFNRAVFDEDRVACEYVQLGISEAKARKTGILGNEEKRIYEFQRAYMKIIESKNYKNVLEYS